LVVVVVAVGVVTNGTHISRTLHHPGRRRRRRRDGRGKSYFQQKYHLPPPFTTLVVAVVVALVVAALRFTICPCIQGVVVKPLPSALARAL